MQGQGPIHPATGSQQPAALCFRGTFANFRGTFGQTSGGPLCNLLILKELIFQVPKSVIWQQNSHLAALSSQFPAVSEMI